MTITFPKQKTAIKKHKTAKPVGCDKELTDMREIHILGESIHLIFLLGVVPTTLRVYSAMW